MCKNRKLDDKIPNSFTNPVVIFEVLSRSTEDHDRTSKFEIYRVNPDLREYVLVNQYRPEVIHYQLVEGVWRSIIYAVLEDVLHLSSIDCAIQLGDVYERVMWE